MTVIYHNKTANIIETIYEFPSGNLWAIDRSTPDGVYQVILNKGIQSDNKTDIQSQSDAITYYLSNKSKIIEVWTIEVENSKGEKSIQTIKEGIQPDGITEIKDATSVQAKLESEGFTVKKITSKQSPMIETIELQKRPTAHQIEKL